MVGIRVGNIAGKEKTQISIDVLESESAEEQREPLLNPISVEEIDNLSNENLKEFLNEEIKEMRILALPASLCNVVEYIPVMLTFSVIGHLSIPENELVNQIGAISIGYSYMSLTGLSFVFGCVSALRTLFSQAIGAGRPELCGLYIQRAAFIGLFICIAASLALWFSESGLILLGQSPEIALYGSAYIRRIIPQIFLFFILNIFLRYLQAHEKAFASFICQTISNATTPFFLWLFVRKMDMEYLGAAWAANAYLALGCFILALYIGFSDLGYVFRPKPFREIIESKGLVRFLTLAIPGLIQVCLQFWLPEVVSIMAGWLFNAKQAISAITVIKGIQSLFGMVWIGILIYNSVRVGSLIGMNSVKRARQVALLGTSTAVGLGMIFSLMVWVFRSKVPFIYTKDPSVVRLAEKLIPIFLAMIPFDALNLSVFGVIVGLGQQKIAALVQFISYYCIGLPIGAILAFKVFPNSENSIVWLWMGLFLATSFSACIQSLILYRLDWNYAVHQARDRIAIDNEAEYKFLGNVSSDSQDLI